MISEETDLLEPTLLDELICHIGTLASVYHKPPNAFVEGRHATKKNLPLRSGQDGNTADDEDTTGPDMLSPNNPTQAQPVVFGGNVGSLIDDFDILGPMPTATHTTTSLPGQVQPRAPSAVPNLLDDELSSILGTDIIIGAPTATTPQTVTQPPVSQPVKSGGNLLDDLFGDLSLGGPAGGLSFSNPQTFSLPKEVN